ncbi:hypothetical protein L1049_028147 [Liquidambar formosana]|uniref:Transcription termination factor MTERF15, mitochondrial n=1 Tax=Liquidambar formosana TaxID=63359 RepID=A0AAP0WWJ2_LIQFO
MAIRVLTRSTLRLLTSTPTIRFQKIRSFSPNPYPNSQIPISPEFSQQPHYRKLISLANLLRRYGFPQSQLHNFLKKNRFLLEFNLLEIEKSLGILLNFKISQKSLVSMICNCPGVLELEFLRKWETGFSELGFSSVLPSMVPSVLELSRRLQIDPDEFSRSVTVLKGLGFSDGTVGRVLEEFPRVIMMNESEIRRRIGFLVGIGIPKNGVGRVYYSVPGILAYGVEDRLKPLFDEFGRLGFSMDVVKRNIVREPRILGMELGELARCLELLSTLKCRVPIKDKIFSEGAFRAGFEVKLRVDCLCRRGLIRREAFKVLWKEPRSIIYEVGDIEKKIEFLVQRMKLNVGCLVEVPEYLGVSFEKQIVPRYSVIEYLRSKGGLGCEVGLRGLIKPSRLRFYNLYVKPYPECEKMFGRFSGDVDVKNQHPVGLWKLFKPQRYPDSKEDVENMKSFMESLV